MNDSELEFTAYHEAGHCVVAILRGARANTASIAPEEDHLYGHVEIEWQGRRTYEAELSVLLAGPVAEMIYRGEPLHPARVAQWSDDWNRACRLASRKHANPKAAMQWIEQCLRKLYLQLSDERHWAAIAAVSDLLLAHEDIEHEQIYDEVCVWLGE